MKKEPSDDGKALTLKLFSRYESHVSIRLLMENALPWYDLQGIVLVLLSQDLVYPFSLVRFAGIFVLKTSLQTCTG